MLFLGEDQVTRNQVATLYGVDLKKLEKRPSFEVYKSRKWIDSVNNNLTKSGTGMSFRSHFVVTDPRDGLEKMLRYCTSTNKSVIGKELNTIYKPRHVDFMGMTKAFKNDLDLALFFFLLPCQESSPFRNPNHPLKLSYIDHSARAKDKISAANKVREALNHVESLSDEKLIVLAKGMGFKKVYGSDIEMTRANLMEYASQNSKAYLEKASNELTLIEGRIRNLIDENMFILEKINGIRRWTWGSGALKGSSIIDIMNQTADAKDVLVNHIFAHLNDFMAQISQMNDQVTARKIAQKTVVSNQVEVEEGKTIGENLPDYLKETVQTKLPQSFAECKDYLIKLTGKNQSVTKISKLMNGIKDGEVTAENIEFYQC